MIGSLIYILVVGWKLALVYLSVSPLVVLAFNLTIKVINYFINCYQKKKFYLDDC
jgi:hypothetical protein